MPYNSAADSFHTNKFCSTLSSCEVHFLYGSDKIVAFEAPFGGLGATYDVHLGSLESSWATSLSVVIELFSLGAFVLSQYTRLTDGRTDRISTAIPCVYASHSRTVKTWQLRMHCNLRQPDAAQSLSALIRRPCQV